MKVTVNADGSATLNVDNAEFDKIYKVLKAEHAALKFFEGETHKYTQKEIKLVEGMLNEIEKQGFVRG